MDIDELMRRAATPIERHYNEFYSAEFLRQCVDDLSDRCDEAIGRLSEKMRTAANEGKYYLDVKDGDYWRDSREKDYILSELWGAGYWTEEIKKRQRRRLHKDNYVRISWSRCENKD